ncbi:hypothetical protein AAVH_43377 [Aphelenchoides avenae]|nr:hypothetical protein AAVH_43377 [Aphelenchus avenae]
MHVVFDPDRLNWQDFIASSGDVQTGYGYAARFQLGHGYFEGTPYQRGHGLGSVFRSLWRFLLPLGKQAAASLGREGLAATSRVLNSVLDANNGADIKETVKREAAASAANLLTKASERVRQSGRGGRRSIGQTNSLSVDTCGKPYKALYTRVGPAPPSSKKRSNSKRRRTRVDVLGSY